jgi:hypothetical protein
MAHDVKADGAFGPYNQADELKYYADICLLGRQASMRSALRASTAARSAPTTRRTSSSLIAAMA